MLAYAQHAYAHGADSEYSFIYYCISTPPFHLFIYLYVFTFPRILCQYAMHGVYIYMGLGRYEGEHHECVYIRLAGISTTTTTGNNNNDDEEPDNELCTQRHGGSPLPFGTAMERRQWGWGGGGQGTHTQRYTPFNVFLPPFLTNLNIGFRL